VNTLGVRNLFLGMLVLAFVGCSSSTTPSGQSQPGSVIPSNVSKVRADTSCGSFTFGPGNNGTYTVGIGDTCVMYEPTDDLCMIGVQSGNVYEMTPSSPIHGTFTGGQIGTSSATYKRTSSGDVTVTVTAFPAHLTTCTVGGGPSQYATATLN
jgi:hypothetical protein